MAAASILVQRLRNAFGLSRQAARAVVRSYDSGAGGRRWAGAGAMPTTIGAQLAAGPRIAQRARYLAANNGHAAAGVEAWVSELVGSGLKPQSAHPDPEMRAAINARFNQWCDEADVDGASDFFGLQAQVARRLVVDGEIFATMFIDDGRRLRVRLIDGAQVDGAYHTELAAGARIVAGIEFDASGQRVAYHLWRSRPGLPLAAPVDLIRLPAEDVVHVFRAETPGQVRGVSWFAPVLLRLADLDKAHDAQLMRQQIAAMMAGFITDPNGGNGGFEGSRAADGALDGGLEPGTLKVLQPGQDIRFSEPATIGQEATEFLRVTAREIAAGLGVPYEAMTGDMSQVNYSSIRAGLVAFRRRVEALQHNTLVFQFCRPIWRRWVTAEILSGRLDAPGFEQDPEAYLAARWLPPKVDWVDPLKDAQAEILAINAGLMSRRQAVAARGYDLEQLDTEIAQDRAVAQAQGLSFSSSVSPSAGQGEQQ